MAATLTYAGAGTAKTNPTDPATFTALPIGTAAADRYVVVVVGGGDDNAASNIAPAFSGATFTIGGQSMSRVTGRGRGTGGGGLAQEVAIYISDAPVTSGTTADLVMSGWTEASTDSLNAYGYALTGADPTPFDSAGLSGTSLTLVDVPANGCCLAAMVCGSEAAQTWGYVTEDFDQDIGEVQVSAGHINDAAGATAPSITCSGCGTTELIAASWGPAAAASTNSNFFLFMQ